VKLADLCGFPSKQISDLAKWRMRLLTGAVNDLLMVAGTGGMLVCMMPLRCHRYASGLLD
jgi:hypothetical protein